MMGDGGRKQIAIDHMGDEVISKCSIMLFWNIRNPIILSFIFNIITKTSTLRNFEPQFIIDNW